MSIRLIVPALCLALVLGSASGSLFKNLYDQHQTPDQRYQRDYKLDELKEPHYFTKYLEKNDLEGARSNGRIDLESDEVLGVKGAGDFTSFAGYFNVNKACNSNMYAWFFQNKVSLGDLVPLIKWPLHFKSEVAPLSDFWSKKCLWIT